MGIQGSRDRGHAGALLDSSNTLHSLLETIR
nr:MAG TPA: hypothetical protein [Inoviridae sp.]